MAVAVIAPFAPRGPAYAAHSTTQQAIVGGGLLDFAVQKNLAYTPGMRVRMSATASDSWMEGVVRTYSDTALTIEVNLSDGGGGPYKDWNINLAGEPGIVPTYAGTATNARIVETHFSNSGPSSCTFRLKTLAGDDPSDSDIVRVLFPNGTLRLISDPGVYTTIANATSLGSVNGLAFRVWILLIDDFEHGVIKLGAIQTRNAITNSINWLSPNGFIPPSRFSSGPTLSGEVYIIAPLPTVPLPYVVLGFADYDSGQVTAGAWHVSPTRIVMFGPGVKLPGDELQTQGNQTGQYGGYGDIIIPLDNTVPLLSEGVQVLIQPITPRCAQSVMEVEAQMIVSFETAGRILTGALFDSRGTLSLATTWTSQTRSHLYLWVKSFAYTTNTFSYSARIGLSGAGASAFNGDNTGGVYGGTCDSYIQVIERQT